MLTEEPFAPVMPVLDFKKLDEVIAAANNTRYGLAAYVFTNDLTSAWKLAEGLEAGIIGVNDPVPATPQCPFGGMKESGWAANWPTKGWRRTWRRSTSASSCGIDEFTLRDAFEREYRFRSTPRRG